MHNSELQIAAIIGENCLTLEQICGLCAVEQEWVLQHMDEGLLSGLQADSGEWCFSDAELKRAKRILAIERTFDAIPELAALVADMQEELDVLRRTLRHVGIE
jgi:chaperone modulatory protein CbpM